MVPNYVVVSRASHSRNPHAEEGLVLTQGPHGCCNVIWECDSIRRSIYDLGKIVLSYVLERSDALHISLFWGVS